MIAGGVLRWWPLWLAALAGCAQVPQVPVARPAQVESRPFALNGRISVRYDGQHRSAGLRWVHQTASDELLLQGPLGRIAARVYRDAGGATLDDGNRQYREPDVESLMQAALGWRLPLDGLHQWVLGLAADGKAEIERDAQGRIAVLRESGWEVRYLRYGGEGADSLPARVQLSHEDLQVQLLIDEWQWEVQ